MKEFGLGEILTVTTGRFLSRSGVGGLYEILNYMTGDNLFTHQLPRASEVCKGPLLEQHPQLANVEVSHIGKDNWQSEMDKLEAEYGKFLSVEPLKEEMWFHIDPVSELSAMVDSEGTKPKIIVVEA